MKKHMTLKSQMSELEKKKKEMPKELSEGEMTTKLAMGYKFLYKLYSKEHTPIGLGIYGDGIAHPVIPCSSAEDIDYRYEVLLECSEYLKGGNPEQRKELQRKALKAVKEKRRLQNGD